MIPGPHPTTKGIVFERRNQQHFGAIGNVDFGKRSAGYFWDSLPGTSEELEAVKKIASDSGLSCQTIAGKSADRAALKEISGYEYVHLSTHAYHVSPDFTTQQERQLELYELRPGLMSWLVLANANQDFTNILTADDILQVDFGGCRLAVISGCDSARGFSGLTGSSLCLADAVFLAGADSVIGSVQDVEDEYASRFLARFYFNLWNRKMSPVQALRATQLWALDGGLKLPHIENNRSPEAMKYWANWLHQGDWR